MFNKFNNDPDRNEEIQQREPLTTAQKNFMFAHLLRCPALFAAAKGIFLPDDVPISDVYLAATWQAALNLANRNEGKLPEPAAGNGLVLATEIASISNQYAAFRDKEPRQMRELYGDADAGYPGFVDWTFGLKESDLNENEARNLLSQYLNEIKVMDNIRAYVRKIGNKVPDSLEPFLKSLEANRAAVLGLTEEVAECQFPEIWIPEEPRVSSTGVKFMDEFMNGGHDPGSVNVVLGSTGGGKSTLAMQMAVELARLFQKDEKNGKPVRHCYYVSYEQQVHPEVYYYLWSYAGRISLNTFRKQESLSTKDNFKPYEIQRKFTDSEQERYARVHQEFDNRNLWLMDFAGGHPGVGYGGVSELAHRLMRYEPTRKFGAVYIDYAGLAIKNYMKQQGTKDSDEWRLLDNYVNEVRREIAIRFQCPVWVFHQLVGQMGTKSPGASLHHTWARGARNFVDNATFAFVLGNIDPSSSCLRIECTKHRFAEPKSPIVVRLDGEIRCMTSADKDMATDPTGRHIIRKEEARAFVDPSVVEASKGTNKHNSGKKRKNKALSNNAD